uniref:Major intrinsic protein n=1 Tax=viral metagenome TaxID=1070528 RepID=A0A6C0I6L6_9ZZZZ
MYPYTVEYLGTLLLISVIAFVGNPYAIGAALTVAILLGGGVSGGHFNPAVSVWAWLSGKLPTNSLGMYVAAQTAAGATVWVLSRLM